MSRKLPISNLTFYLIALLTFNFLLSCDSDEDAPKILPEVTTATISNITTTSATGGGNIVSDGNDKVTAMGLVYSSTNTTPTAADSKTVAISSAASFTSELTGLTSGTTYHVRAYATNSIGTAYGTTVDFVTGNSAPTVSGVEITGDLEIDVVLTASYTYNDAENDLESGTMFKWYSATDGSGAGETAIDGATESTYTIKATDEFKWIRVGVTPMASVGTTTGVEVKSNYLGPVPEAPETVTFVYNKSNVTYGVIISPVTSRRWLDRNLGASQIATAFDDFMAYGDLFQWGRGTDGHQLISWTSCCGGGGSPQKSTTNELSDSDQPTNDLFIINSITPSDWRNSKNDNLWQGVNGTNNPCPEGWRLPTNTEWDAEIGGGGGNYVGLGPLLLSAAGYRKSGTGLLQLGGSTGAGGSGYYWSSTTNTEGQASVYIIYKPNFLPSYFSYYPRASGASCRCIKDEVQ